jgi:hypothetical protein
MLSFPNRKKSLIYATNRLVRLGFLCRMGEGAYHSVARILCLLPVVVPGSRNSVERICKHSTPATFNSVCWHSACKAYKISLHAAVQALLGELLLAALKS